MRHPARFLASLSVLAALLSLPACATGNRVDVQLVDRNQGGVLDTYLHHGQAWVAGTPGHRYAVRLSNRTGGRVMVVLSVDGINAITGQTAAYGQTGYVLEPWSTTEITGWRKNMNEAAAFYFAALPDTYAARTNRPDNAGVVGVAVFREKMRPPVMIPRESEMERLRDSSAPMDRARAGSAAKSAAAPMAQGEVARREDRIGTGHGEREYAPVSQTEFEQASSRPDEVVQLRYDTRARLAAAGIIPRHHPMPRQPEAFPTGFVPDPWGR